MKASLPVMDEKVAEMTTPSVGRARISRVAWMIPFLLMGCAAGSRAPWMPRELPTTPEAHTARQTLMSLSVSIRGGVKAVAMDSLSNALLQTGWSVAQANDYQIVYEKDAQEGMGLAAIAVIWSDTQPIWRLTTRFAQSAEQLIVNATLERVENPGTDHTQRTEMRSGKPAAEVQMRLDHLKSRLEGGAGADTTTSGR